MTSNLHSENSMSLHKHVSFMAENRKSLWWYRRCVMYSAGNDDGMHIKGNDAGFFWEEGAEHGLVTDSCRWIRIFQKNERLNHIIDFRRTVMGNRCLKVASTFVFCLYPLHCAVDSLRTDAVDLLLALAVYSKDSQDLMSVSHSRLRKNSLNTRWTQKETLLQPLMLASKH